MKNATNFIITILVLVSSCNRPKTKEVPSKPKSQEELLKDRYEHAKMIIQFESDKIFLISKIKHLNPDTVKLILIEYYANCPDYMSFDDDFKNTFEKTIKDISQKFKISSSKASAIIYSFKYEMITKEEIRQEAQEEIETDREVEYDYEENYDPRY